MAAIRYLVADTDEAVRFYADQFGSALRQRMGPAFAMSSGMVSSSG